MSCILSYLAALRGVNSGGTHAMLPRRALVADGGSGNASIRVSTAGKAGCIIYSTTEDAAHERAHKLPKSLSSRHPLLFPSRGPVLCSGWPANAGEAAKTLW